MSNKPANYMSNKEFYAELIKCQDNGEMSDKLGEMFMKLAKHYSNKRQFVNIHFKDEMVDAAIVACCSAFMKFDRNKGVNTFAYFTSVIHNSFLQILNHHKKQRQIRDQMLVDNNLNPSHNYYNELREMEEERLEKEASEESKESDNFDETEKSIDLNVDFDLDDLDENE